MEQQTPGFVNFDDDEAWRLKRADLALLMAMPVDAVDDLPLEMSEDVYHLRYKQDELKAWMRRKRGGA